MTKRMTEHSMEEVKFIIGNKADLYDAAIRNGWYLPKMKSSIITEEYITNVITGKVFCPRFSDIKLVPCPKPPEKQLMLKDFARLVNSKKKESGIDESHTPDKNWLLAVLGTYNPALPYFKKGYVPPPKNTQAASVTKVQLPENFLEGLPNSKRKVKIRKLALLSKSKEDGKLKRFKLLKEKFASEYLKEKNRIEAKAHKQRNDNENMMKQTKKHGSPQTPNRGRDPLTESINPLILKFNIDLD